MFCWNSYLGFYVFLRSPILQKWQQSFDWLPLQYIKMTLSNGNIFRVTGPLLGEFTGHWWILLTKASDAELWCFLWSTPEKIIKQSRRRWFETPLHLIWRRCSAKKRNMFNVLRHNITVPIPISLQLFLLLDFTIPLVISTGWLKILWFLNFIHKWCPHVLVCLSLLWRHNGHDGVSNHQPHDCLLNRLFRRRLKKTSKLSVIGLCAGNSPLTGEFPAQRASNAENVAILWRHHVSISIMKLQWNLSVTTTSRIKCIIFDLFSNVF